MISQRYLMVLDLLDLTLSLSLHTDINVDLSWMIFMKQNNSKHRGAIAVHRGPGFLNVGFGLHPRQHSHHRACIRLF